MDADYILIDEIRKHPALYDYGNKDYTNLLKKDFIWREIGRGINLDGEQCKKRWKCLRDCYQRCKRAESTSLGTAANNSFRKKKWKMYDRLTFLDNYKRNRSFAAITKDDDGDDDENDIFSSAALSETEESVEYKLNLDEINAELDETSVKLNETPNLEEVPLNSAKYQTNVKGETILGSSPAVSDNNVQTHDEFLKFLDMAAESVKETCASFKNKSQDDNSTTMLFASLARKLKETQMPDAIINDIEAKVSALVFAEIENYYKSSQR